MQSKLEQFQGSKEAVETARLLVDFLPIMVTRVIISGPRLGTALLFSMIEADSGITDQVRKISVRDSSTVDEIKAVFAEARQLEDAVVCVEEVESINTPEKICTLLAELDEPANKEITVFFLTRTPIKELDVMWHRRFLLDIQLESAAS